MSAENSKLSELAGHCKVLAVFVCEVQLVWLIPVILLLISHEIELVVLVPVRFMRFFDYQS